jgi:nucleotide-binding universal stress UspA family protein
MAAEVAGAGRGRIVVGVDGSPGSRAALRWALGQAQRTDARLDVVRAVWHPGDYEWAAMPTNYGTVPLPIPEPHEDLIAAAGESLAEVVRDVIGDDPPVPVTTRAVDGQASGVLLDAAKDADLLVLGRHGHGGLIGMVLGSVSRHCVEHAPCGVVVIPADPDS